jgi:hypothetical protein
MIAKAELTGTIGRILPTLDNSEEILLGKLTSAGGYVSLHRLTIVQPRGRHRPCRRLWRQASVALPGVLLNTRHNPTVGVVLRSLRLGLI